MCMDFKLVVPYTYTCVHFDIPNEERARSYLRDTSSKRNAKRRPPSRQTARQLFLIPDHLKGFVKDIEVMHERSECVCENSYRVWSVEGSTEGTSQGAEPRGRSPRLIPTHDTRGGIAHTLEHMSECIINTTQT